MLLEDGADPRLRAVTDWRAADSGLGQTSQPHDDTRAPASVRVEDRGQAAEEDTGADGSPPGAILGADPLKQFGANLRRMRDDAGISQEVLAQDARLDRAAISIIERGTRAANLRTVLKLAWALEVPPSALLADIY
jgi:DNA-binding XRE family transcriptional regulator